MRIVRYLISVLAEFGCNSKPKGLEGLQMSTRGLNWIVWLVHSRVEYVGGVENCFRFFEQEELNGEDRLVS